MFAAIFENSNLSSSLRRPIERLDDRFFGSTLTGPSRRRRARQFAHQLVDQGYSREEIMYLALEKYG